MMKEFAHNYYNLLIEDYKGINLTRITEFNDFYRKQILDSIAPYQESLVFKNAIDEKRVFVDIGFGGGFPLVPMAKLLPKCKFIGIETRNKKVKVVGEIANKLGLVNTKFFHSRIENVLIDMDCVCTFKAVGKVFDFLSKIYTTKYISVFFYKGPNFYELEADQIEKSKENWDIIEEREIVVPGTEKRLLIGFQNKNVLHGTKNIKQLVKLSSIL